MTIRFHNIIEFLCLKIEYDIIYDKFDNVIKVNGKVVGYVEMDSEQTSNILDTISTNNYGSMLMVAKNILNAWSTQGILSHYAGKFYVSGYVSFTLQRRNDASSRYANRKLYMKIVLASKKYKSKTRSLGNGGWFKSTRPNY